MTAKDGFFTLQSVTDSIKKPECERSGFFMRQDKSISTSSESKFHFIPEKTILGVQIHREEM